ncbi:phosphotransferase family protein [Penicillium vulpinum]|uniref:phosphotransferase family protein n=1 Tax=Penicillium vulpinum TaxID=29845 RepID=UPI002548D6B4|nr:phosphotransferase family protein [Penicillium vulpinum]KAJ5959244.1 phosphotransferase family protein [Penicillium vulpinum]
MQHRPSARLRRHDGCYSNNQRTGQVVLSPGQMFMINVERTFSYSLAEWKKKKGSLACEAEISRSARKSFAFDAVYWQKIDDRFWKRDWEEILNLLDETEKQNMEVLVKRKMQEIQKRVLAWGPIE